MRRLIIAMTTTLGLFAAPVSAEPVIEAGEAEVCEGCEALLDLALAHPRRKDDRARDVWRHPAETLAFFKVRPGMTIIDYMPAGGWYTRVLVPYLGEGGKYVGLNPAPGENEAFRNYVSGLREKFPRQAAAWNLDGAAVDAYNTDELPEAMNGTVDRVLIFREMHNLHRNGILASELGRVHALLKDGALLGIVQHRAKADAPAEYVGGGKGYMREQDVVGLVEAQGFELVGKSEINANPRDTADHEGGVWELPPVLRGNREDLRAIGESDRMTLLFRKQG